MKQEDEQGNSFFTQKYWVQLRKKDLSSFLFKKNKKLGSIKYHNETQHSQFVGVLGRRNSYQNSQPQTYPEYPRKSWKNRSRNREEIVSGNDNEKDEASDKIGRTSS